MHLCCTHYFKDRVWHLPDITDASSYVLHISPVNYYSDKAGTNLVTLMIHNNIGTKDLSTKITFSEAGGFMTLAIKYPVE